MAIVVGIISIIMYCSYCLYYLASGTLILGTILHSSGISQFGITS